MLDLHQFFRATNPAKTLAVENEEDRKYYIDFSSVRGQDIATLREDIANLSDGQPTCSLFTGHIGSGKSTELLRLKKELQQQGFHIVYFESDQDLEMGDIDVSDILLTIANRVSISLAEAGIELQSKSLLNELKQFLQDLQPTSMAFSLGIAEITAEMRASPNLRNRLRGYLEPLTNRLIQSINRELLEPAVQKLQQRGQQGLVVIIDNLDRIDFSPRPSGRPQPEYLFIDRASALRSLHCHVVYTVPLALLRFSDDFKVIGERFLSDPIVLPMVPVRFRNGQAHEAGMALLRQMVLARAFPNLEPNLRLGCITEIFDSPESLDRLCCASGGHVRNLLRFLNRWIRKERQLPLSRSRLEEIIQEELHQSVLGIFQTEWELLRHVAQSKNVSIFSDDQKPRYQKLLRNLLVLEYSDQDGRWFDINPILAGSKELQE